jgi:lipopolysaccharide biosynthesis glycosyltransferase
MNTKKFTNSFYCIQRCSEREKSVLTTRKGVDLILSFDYMGSAEFEFGALPTTFKLFRELASKNDLVLNKTSELTTFSNKPFWYIIPKAWSQTDFEKQLVELTLGKTRTQELTYMDAWVKQTHSGRDEEIKYCRSITTWVAIVQRYQADQHEGKQPAIWGVNEGTIRKVWDEVHGKS